MFVFLFFPCVGDVLTLEKCLLIMLLLFFKVRIEESCLVRNDCQLRMLSVNPVPVVLESFLLQRTCVYQKIKLLGCRKHCSLDKFC